MVHRSVIEKTPFALQDLQEALVKNQKQYKEDVNYLHLYNDKREFGKLALLHCLVIGSYTHQEDLLLSLIMFSSCHINQRTSNNHTAFQLAVVVSETAVYYVGDMCIIMYRGGLYGKYFS